MKKHHKILIAVCAAVFSLAAITPADAFEAGVRAYAWFPQLSADVRGNGTIAGTTASLTDTLGVGNKPLFSGEIYGGMGKHHLSFMYTPVRYSDTKTLGSDVTFSGTTFNAGSGVKTELDLSMFDLKYQYDIVNAENFLAGFSLGPIVQVKYLSGEMKLTGSGAGAGTNQKQTFSAPVPMIGLGAHIGLIANWLEARAQIAGMGYAGNLLIEGLADLSLTPYPFVDIHAGYKIMKLKVSTNSFYMDSQFSGPFTALTIGF